MAAADMVSGLLLFVRQLHEHSSKVLEGMKLLEPLADALLAQNQEEMARWHGQIAKIATEADEIKLALYDQIKNMHFCSPGSYAFSQYVRCQSRIIDSARDFADLLLVRKTTISVELQAAFRALIAHIVGVSGQMMDLARSFSSPVEGDSTDPQGQDVREAIAGIIEGSRRARQFEMEFVRQVYRQERQLDAGTVLMLDRYHAALRKITDAVECAANHLRLLIP
jgi:uncharacterized protein Yka (UPF0111/DUF47 family)